ncbi:hypothetical protein NE236_07060 [Actinoallomurus purpureus]|uniref:hypothetical protein n=1 Tax=Actinoallomurus purpureus TaxID=478114 RepID=UPI002092F506|nr:hypothetical protein [Actinoallomurus purpureus]MCO6004734.1 hypothetical protein [Actinoallomurus purpureus]
MTRSRSDSGTRRLTLELPAELVEWVWAFAEISHRTVEDVVRPLIEAEKARVTENWERNG